MLITIPFQDRNDCYIIIHLQMMIICIPEVLCYDLNSCHGNSVALSNLSVIVYAL